MTRQDAISAIEGYFDGGAFFEELDGRVAIRTASSLPESGGELRRYLDENMIPYLEGMGFGCEVHPNPRSDAGPFLVARRHEGDGLPTVMTYGHGDVVAGYDDEWSDGMGPWRVTRKGERWYGRGTADNKGQHTINLAAMKAVLAVRGSLGFNVVMLLEMGEERGSPGLREFCSGNAGLFGADVFVASDGPRVEPGKPTMFMGTRGVFNFTMRYRAREGGHHSGNWGGLLTNPGVVMAHALASMVDPRGMILVDGWRNTRIPASVRAAIAKLKVGGGEGAPAINPDWGEPDMTPEERVFASNTFEIRAFECGNPRIPANAIPPQAVAHGHLRFVAGTDFSSLLPALRAHLDSRGFKEIEIEADRDAMNATRLDPDHPWAKWAAASLAETAGAEIAVVPNLGGSLPNDVFADILGLPTIWIPHSYAGCSQHAPDEHILESGSRSALRLMAGLWWDLGSGDTPAGAKG